MKLITLVLNPLRWILISLLVSKLTAGELKNFTALDVEFRSAAEAARDRSARFWSGRPLPGDWSAPCPMVWSQSTGPGSGMTSFQFQRGEVFGWRMTLRGTREQVLSDVIPHEVDHTVRATLCRRPLPRWLDEGSASLFESENSHARLREVLMRSPRPLLTPSTLDESTYPADEAQMAQLYSEGFSLVEYLLTLGTPRDLLRVQQSVDPPSRSLVQVYRLETPQLLADWQNWQRQRLQSGTKCDCVNCPYHRTRPGNATTPTKPVLTIWTAEWCEPCQRFHADLAGNAAFRKELASHFRLIERDFDQFRTLATSQGVSTVPTFQPHGREVRGYQGADWLLEQLRVKSLTSRENPVPAETLPKTEAEPTQPPGTIEPPDKAPLRIAPLVIPTGPSLLTPSQPERAPPLPEASQPRVGGKLWDLAPTVISVLTSAGVISGTALTGGVGGVALMLAWQLLKRRATRVVTGKTEGGVAGSVAAPFPRELDEAGELLGLRKSEGRVATLDTLRGMFLDDELSKLHDSPDPAASSLAQKLRAAIDKRVDEVAPLTTKG